MNLRPLKFLDRDRLEKVILIFTEDNYKSFCESVTDYMKK